MGYNQGVLPSTEARVINSNNWQKATNGQMTALWMGVIKVYRHRQCAVFVTRTQASPRLRLVSLSSSLGKWNFIN